MLDIVENVKISAIAAVDAVDVTEFAKKSISTLDIGNHKLILSLTLCLGKESHTIS